MVTSICANQRRIANSLVALGTLSLLLHLAESLLSTVYFALQLFRYAAYSNLRAGCCQALIIFISKPFPSMQDVFNLLPNLRMEELSRAFSVKTNDSMLIIYVSALIRSVLALHGLIENKEQRAEAQQAAEKAALDADDKSKSGTPAPKDGADSGSNPSGETLNEQAGEGHPPGAGP